MKIILIPLCLFVLISCQSEMEKSLIKDIECTKIELDSIQNIVNEKNQLLKKLEDEKNRKELNVQKLDSNILSMDSLIIELKDSLKSNPRVGKFRKVIVY